MKHTVKIVSLLLCVLLAASSFVFTATAESAALAVDTTTLSGTAGNSGEGFDKLFDGSTSTKYCTMNNQAEIIFALTETAVVTYYELTAADQSARDPRSWTLYGSGSGDSWTEIDSRSGEDFYGTATTNGYEVEGADSYLWYKLEITENHGADPWGYDILALAELALYAAAPGEEDGIKVVPSTVSGTEGDGSNTVFNLFDANAATKYLVKRSSDEDEVTVQFSLNKAAAVNAYKLTSANDWDVRDPKDWKVYGSDDGDLWYEIDARTDEDLPARSTAYLYEIPAENVEEFQWYKFVFTANNGTDPFGLNIIQIADLEVLEIEGEVDDGSITVDLSTVQSSEANPSEHVIEHLFDNNTGTKFLTTGSAMFVSFALKKERVINTYSLTCAGDWASRTPSAWTFYGSNDGNDWVKLDERSGENPVGLLKDNRYVFDNDTAYLWYKLDVTANGGNAYTGFAELKLGITEDAPNRTRKLEINASSAEGPAGTSGSNALTNLFDVNNESRYLTQNTSGEIVFSLEHPAPVNRYSFVGSRDHLERSPKTFAFYGFDGEEWVELDRQDLPAKTASDPNFFCGGTYSFENNVVYLKYKFVIEAVSSGSYIGMGGFAVYCETPADGLDVYAPAAVTDLTGIPAAAKLKSVVVKAPEVSSSDAAALDAAGPVTVYGHDAAAFESCANVTFINLLSVEASFTGSRDGKGLFTTVGAVKAPDLDYEELYLNLSFSYGSEVKTKSVRIRTVYYTITGYASVNESTAVSQGYETIDAAYIAAVSVKNIPDGAYAVTAQLVGKVKDAGGALVEVSSDVYSTNVTFPA